MRGDFIMRGDGAVKLGIDIENARHTADSGENTILLGYDGRGRTLAGIDAGVAGGIARGPVFEQRVLEDSGEAS